MGRGRGRNVGGSLGRAWGTPGAPGAYLGHLGRTRGTWGAPGAPRAHLGRPSCPGEPQVERLGPRVPLGWGAGVSQFPALASQFPGRVGDVSVPPRGRLSSPARLFSSSAGVFPPIPLPPAQEPRGPRGPHPGLVGIIWKNGCRTHTHTHTHKKTKKHICRKSVFLLFLLKIC